MSDFFNKIYQKPKKVRVRIFWGGIALFGMILLLSLFWQQKNNFSSLKISGDYPKFKLPKEEISNLKELFERFRTLKRPGISPPKVKKEDLEKLSEEDRKLLEEVIKKYLEGYLKLQPKSKPK